MTSDLNIRTILDDVVHQFSDPLAFFRELVQNSIDAGSQEIEIELEHSLDDQGADTAVISVRDWGEGMNREIIETKLVRLFSSGKDDDLTKIGQFGIGFVSVFAIAPEAVVVDTGRDGQFWRVFFSQDRTYELFALEAPVEGTYVRVFKTMNEAAFQALREGAEEAIVAWCKHAPVPVLLDGRDVREPFELPMPFTSTYEEQGTRIVMGFSDPTEAFAGYYNRGLTLKESTRSPWSWASYKIDSRYLEHTLTRDQLIMDEHFEKAETLLRELAVLRLPDPLVDRLEELVNDDDLNSDYDTICRYLGWYLEGMPPSFGHQTGNLIKLVIRGIPEPGTEFMTWQWQHQYRKRQAWVRRKLFKTCDGTAVTARQLSRAWRRGHLVMTRENGVLARHLSETKSVVLSGPDGGACGFLVQLFGHLQVPGIQTSPHVPIIEDEYLLLDAIRDAATDRAKAASTPRERAIVALELSLTSLIAAALPQVDAVHFAPAELIPATQRTWPGTVVPVSAEPVSADMCRPCAPEWLRSGYALIVNISVAEVERLARLAEREPEWAAFSLIKLFTAEGGAFPDEVEDGLLRAAVHTRNLRREGAR